MQFDQTVWLDRAERRLRNGTCAPDRHDADVRSIVSIGAVVSWCARRRVSVSFTRSPGAQYDDATRTIQVNGRLRPETQLHMLLHECGHHLVTSGTHGRFPRGYGAVGAVKRSTAHRIDVLDEELDAWDRGLRLARRLNLGVDSTRYADTRAKCVRSYALWVAKVEGYDDAWED